jgi:hypothetical protein
MRERKKIIEIIKIKNNKIYNIIINNYNKNIKKYINKIST